MAIPHPCVRLLLLLLVLSHSAVAQPASWFTGDLDGDGRADTLFTFVENEDARDAGGISAFELRLASGEHLRVEAAEGIWISQDSSLLNRYNAFGPFLAVLPAKGGSVVYARGFRFGCCAPEAALVGVTSGTMHVLLQEDLDVAQVWNEADNLYLRVQQAPQMIEQTDQGWIGTYSQHLIYEVTAEAIVLSENATRRYNEEHYVGYWGAEGRMDVQVLYLSDGSKPRLAR